MYGPNVRKAAVLLASLPEPAAAALRAQLSPAQVELIQRAMAASGPIANDERAAVLEKFIADTLAAEDEATARAGTPIPFQSLARLSGPSVLVLLSEERPQTVALVLSRLPAEQAAEVLVGLPAEVRSTVVQRIAAIGEVCREVIDAVESDLRERASSLPVWRFDSVDGAAAVAGILSVMDHDTEHLLRDRIARGERLPRPADEPSARVVGEAMRQLHEASDIAPDPLLPLERRVA